MNIQLGKSLMYNTNSNGPNMLPCRMPDVYTIYANKVSTVVQICFEPPPKHSSNAIRPQLC